jgi:Rps23 Pro-64 3,4-dihydroxylase Tpa1-like proline 4-hydroxylase
MTQAPFALHPNIDVDRLRASFARNRRGHIAPFLAEEGAIALQDHLRGREDWRLVLNAGPKVYEIDRLGQAALTVEQRAELDRHVAGAAKKGFQYRFENIRVPDEAEARRASNSLLDQFATFMSAPPALDLLRSITGTADIAFADAQATSYNAGDFLTAHDDDVEGKNRRAAYVYGLTHDWQAEWGGLLLFHDAAGDIERGYTPRFNSLNIFSVPQLHSVSYVSPVAPEPRLSVTGWLRAA